METIWNQKTMHEKEKYDSWNESIMGFKNHRYDRKLFYRSQIQRICLRRRWKS